MSTLTTSPPRHKGASLLARTPATDAEALPALALSRPAEALRRAETVLSRAPDDLAASYAHQAAGIVLRDRGDTDAAVRHLRVALRLVQRGQRTGTDPTRGPDVRATLGATLAVAGRTREGLRHLDAAAADSDGLLLARVLMRRAFVLGRLGRHDETLDDLRRAVAVFRDEGDELWEARALTTRARTHLERGALTRAAQDFRRAETLFAAAGQELEADVALHNRGAIAYLVGDLPGALSLFAEAGRRLPGADGFSADLAHDRCELLLAVGFADDALEVADRALADGTASAVVRAHLQLAAATAALTLGDLDGALDRGARGPRALPAPAARVVAPRRRPAAAAGARGTGRARSADRARGCGGGAAAGRDGRRRRTGRTAAGRPPRSGRRPGARPPRGGRPAPPSPLAAGGRHRLARARPGPRARRRPPRGAGRLRPRSRRARRAPHDPRQLGAAGPLHPPRQRPRRTGAAPRRRQRLPPPAAGLERALAGDVAGAAAGAPPGGRRRGPRPDAARGPAAR